MPANEANGGMLSDRTPRVERHPGGMSIPPGEWLKSGGGRREPCQLTAAAAWGYCLRRRPTKPITPSPASSSA